MAKNNEEIGGIGRMKIEEEDIEHLKGSHSNPDQG